MYYYFLALLKLLSPKEVNVEKKKLSVIENIVHEH